MGLYDRLAKVFLYTATVLSKMPRDQVEQIIDDVVAAGTKKQVVQFMRSIERWRETAGCSWPQKTTLRRHSQQLRRARCLG